jgi:hypothetical protein
VVFVAPAGAVSVEGSGFPEGVIPAVGVVEGGGCPVLSIKVFKAFSWSAIFGSIRPYGLRSLPWIALYRL